MPITAAWCRTESSSDEDVRPAPRSKGHEARRLLAGMQEPVRPALGRVLSANATCRRTEGASEKELQEMGHAAVGDVGLLVTVRNVRRTGNGASSSRCQAVVGEILRGGPADEGGIKNGDVILSIDGVHVKPGCEDALQSLCEGQSGSTVSITLLKGQQKEPTTVNLIRRAGCGAVEALPHDLCAPGPCFACLPNPAPKFIGNVSIGFLWPAYLVHLRQLRAQHPDTANTDENEVACRRAKIGFLRLILDLKRYFNSGSLAEPLRALPRSMHRPLNLPKPPRDAKNATMPQRDNHRYHQQHYFLKPPVEEDDDGGAEAPSLASVPSHPSSTLSLSQSSKEKKRAKVLLCSQSLRAFRERL